MKPKRRRGSSLLNDYDKALRIVFGPVAFQAVAVAISDGLLSAVSKSEKGLTQEELCEKSSLSGYAVGRLVPILLTFGVLRREGDGRLRLTGAGECLLYDDMVGVNLRFMKDFCYIGMAKTEESLRSGRPEGLACFNPAWKTVYPHLKDLPEPAKSSWFAFDHYFSDHAFPEAIEILKAYKPQHIADIGGNTGKFAAIALDSLPSAKVTVVDLPEQLRLMQGNKALDNVRSRLSSAAVDWLDPDSVPEIGDMPDIIWMSQFLDCFSYDEDRSILNRLRPLLRPDGRVAVLEPVWDDQRMPMAGMSIAALSLYFTVFANGNSRFFSKDELLKLFTESGFSLCEYNSGLGAGSSLLIFKKTQDTLPAE